MSLMASFTSIYNALRLVSRKYDDPDVQRMISQMPFKVVNDKNRPMLRVEHKQRNIVRIYSPSVPYLLNQAP